MNQRTVRLSEAEREQGALLYLRARETGEADAVRVLKRWMDGSADRRRLVEEMRRVWGGLDAVATEDEVAAWREEAIAAACSADVPARRMPAYMAMAAALLLSIGIVGVVRFQALGTPRERQIASAIGERREVRLADGTHILLDAASRIAVDYDADQRVVKLLAGQARFHVAHDVSRPFHVEVGGDDVQALGTDFNVSTTASTMSVSLIEGSVLMSRLEQRPSYFGLRDPVLRVPTVTLRPGQQFERKDAVAPRVRRFDPQLVTAWQDGRLMFKDLPLADAVALANRYSRRPIVIDPDVPQIRLTAVLNANDSMAFARAVTAYLPGSHLEETSDRITIRNGNDTF